MSATGTAPVVPPTARILGQVIGVERHLRAKDNEMGTDLQKRVQVTQLVTGLEKIYTPDQVDAPPEHIFPDESKEVSLTVEEALREAIRYATPAMNIVATKDRTNQRASADIIIRGSTLVHDVPVSHLLWLENYLGEWRKFVAVLPVMDRAKRWIPVDGSNGLYTAEGETAGKYVEETVPLVLHPGNDRHAPNAVPLTKKVHVGTFRTTHFTGAITEDRKRQLLDRADELIAAVKDATARANRTTAVEDVTEGGALFGYLLNG